MPLYNWYYIKDFTVLEKKRNLRGNIRENQTGAPRYRSDYDGEHSFERTHEYTVHGPYGSIGCTGKSGFLRYYLLTSQKKGSLS